MSRLLGREVSEAQAAAIRTPESALTAGDLAEGLRLLCDLESALLGRNYDGFRNGQEGKVRRNYFSFSREQGQAAKIIDPLVALRLESWGEGSINALPSQSPCFDTVCPEVENCSRKQRFRVRWLIILFSSSSYNVCARLLDGKYVAVGL